MQIGLEIADEWTPDAPGQSTTITSVAAVGRHCVTGEFGSNITTQDGQIGAALGGQAIQFIDEVIAGDAAFHHAAEDSRVCSSMIEAILTGRPSAICLWPNGHGSKYATSPMSASLPSCAAE